MILIDTDILIDLLRSHPKRLAWFEATFRETAFLHISLITKLELLKGCRTGKERQEVVDWLMPFHSIYPDEVISATAETIFTKYFPKQGIGILDAFIAATAVEKKLTLYTLNRKHFQQVTNLEVRVPTDL